MRNMRKKPELLLPAAGPEVLRTAVRFGADAVYIGGEAFGLRAKAKNFTLEEMADGIRFAHARGKKVYVTANILAHNRDLEEAEGYFETLRDLRDADGVSASPDALIVSDPGLFSLAKRIWPDAEFHISTQANNTNYGTYLFWHGLGDANLGECTHPCRWKYAVVEETRPGEYMPIYENERGTFLFNSKDLCMIGHIPELLEAGIDSFKVEGRMKTALYAATVARAYRKAIDDCLESEITYRTNLEWYEQEVRKCTHRRYDTGFFFGRPDESAQIYDESTYINDYVYLGTIYETDERGRARIEQRNRFFIGDRIEVMRPDGRDSFVTVEKIEDAAGNAMESAPHPRQLLWLTLSGGAEAGDILRMKKAGV